MSSWTWDLLNTAPRKDLYTSVGCNPVVAQAKIELTGGPAVYAELGSVCMW